MTRLFDVLVSGVLLLLLSPFLFYRAVAGQISTHQVFIRMPQLGYRQRPFNRLSFAGAASGKNLAVLINVLAGDLAWAGVRALSPAEAEQLGSKASDHFNFRPGVLSAYSLKRQVGLAYDDEFATDHAFFSRLSIKSYIGLCLRGLIAWVLEGDADRPTPPLLHFWGVDILNTTMTEALDWLEACFDKPHTSLLAFVNPACLNIAYTHEDYRQVLQNAECVLPDGIGIKIACRLLGQHLRENVNGTDMFPRLCERAAKAGYSLFLLGGLPGIAEQAATAMQQRFPGLKIAGVQDGFFSDAQEPQVLAAINASGAAVLLVGFGVPKQELWLARYREQLRVPVCMGVGGLFDYYSGRIPRAPVWMREIGIEWTWRLLQEPGRMWRRYLIGNPLFLYRVWRQRQQG
ncbi:WecB/TagA/CpsF family glycosyltransferase [Methylovulum psychrotolerans]|uniref:WecB/TagA/CpsF family glycosyltransferase n=1 Tax=Methylovulum psychrotolerans TaxID=1704499 RepID=UPI001BFF0FCC|nr:WecB/TagA/CpsF family glycosyltransferase [Methylovulum psychrotolerans]MBT9099700.1 WecB/TagA/CpsF family glycosyltransferase [Methylovulum psychrotolerans]